MKKLQLMLTLLMSTIACFGMQRESAEIPLKYFCCWASKIITGALCTKEATEMQFLRAVRARDSKAIAQYIEGGIDVNARDEFGKTSLHWAAARGNGAIVEFLVNHSAAVDVQDADGNTPLHLAALRGKIDVAQILLLHGATVFIQNNCGHTPFHLAAKNSNTDVAKLLLSRYRSDDSTDRKWRY